MKLFFDGGARPNPGAIEVAVVARGTTHLRHDLGSGTNNDAEWLALLHALEIARSAGVTDITLLGDSAIVVGQASGKVPCRTPALRAHLDRFAELAAGFTRVRVRRISRHQNLAGIALARLHDGR